MIQTKRADNSQNPTASGDADEESYRRNRQGKTRALTGAADGQGHLRNHIQRCFGKFGQPINDDLR